MSITLPNFRTTPSSDSHDHTTHAHARSNHHSSDDPIELPGLAQLPGLIQQARQRQANKYKGKRPHEIMSASQWRAANKHNEGKQIHLQKPPKGLVTTDGVHFFSSIRVLNFYERTKNNLVKQQSEVLNRAHTFNERDMNTFQQMWEEKAILEGNIDDLRADIIERSKRLDCACRLDLHVNHLKATRNRNRLVASLQHKERQKQQAYTAKVSKFNDEKEIWMNLKQKLLKDPNPLVELRPPTPLLPPSGLMAFPRAETMDALKYRRTVPVPPVCSFESTDVILQDQKIIQYLVRIFEEGIDQINEIAAFREEKARLEEEDRNRKKAERIALAKAAEEAAMLSSDEDEEEEEVDPDGMEIQQIMAEMIQQIIVAGGEEDQDLILQMELKLKMEEEEEQEEEDSTYAFSEHASDFEDEFDEETYGTGGGAWGAGHVNMADSDCGNEHSRIQNLMATAIVRSKQQLIPPTFMKLISEAFALVPNEVRTRGPRFVDLTGSTGATSILTSLWSLGWSSTVTYEKNYEDLILAKLHVQCIEEILGGAKKKSNDEDSNSSESGIDDDDDDDRPRSRSRSSSPLFPAFKQSSTTIDPKTLSVPYQNNAIRRRLANQACFFRRKFSFAEEHPWSSMDGGAPWSKADVLFVDENKMADIANNFDVANVLRSIVTSEAWVDHRFESSLKNLVYSFAGKDKMYEKNPYTGEPELIESDKMEVLLEELENKDDDSIGQCMKASDPATYEYYHLQHLLHQRKMTAQHLKKLKDNCLVIVIRPERRAIPRSNAHQYYTTVNVKTVVKQPEVVGGDNTVTLATPTTGNKNDVKDVVDEESPCWNRPTDDMRAVLLDRWLNEPFFADSHGENDEDDVDDDGRANESWEGGSGNESDSGDVLERYQHLLDDKTLDGESADGGSSYEEFALSRSSLKEEKTFTLAKAKAQLYFRDHPSASPSSKYTEMLECDESRQCLESPHKGPFQHIDDNFVFKTMKKASLWENGAPVAAILYRRRPRVGSFLMESTYL